MQSSGPGKGRHAHTSTHCLSLNCSCKQPITSLLSHFFFFFLHTSSAFLQLLSAPHTSCLYALRQSLCRSKPEQEPTASKTTFIPEEGRVGAAFGLTCSIALFLCTLCTVIPNGYTSLNSFFPLLYQ